MCDPCIIPTPNAFGESMHRSGLDLVVIEYACVPAVGQTSVGAGVPLRGPTHKILEPAVPGAQSSLGPEGQASDLKVTLIAELSRLFGQGTIRRHGRHGSTGRGADFHQGLPRGTDGTVTRRSS